MQDKEIIELFFKREQDGIAALQREYGGILLGIARAVLGDKRDAEECVNDALLVIWNNVPPEKPASLLAYASRVVRNAAVTKLRADTAKKRKCASSVCLDELAEAVSDGGEVSERIEAAELSALINLFLGSCEKEERDVFILRYYSFMQVSEIAKKYGFSVSKTKMMLKRCRDKLAEYLERNGYKI